MKTFIDYCIKWQFVVGFLCIQVDTIHNKLWLLSIWISGSMPSSHRKKESIMFHIPPFS